MTKQQIASWIIVVLVLAGGYYFYTTQSPQPPQLAQQPEHVQIEEKFPDWVNVEGKVAGYSARFPADPVYQTQEQPLNGSSLTFKQELYVLEEESGTVYVVNTVVYPVPPKDDVAQLLTSARDELMKVVSGAQLLSSEIRSTEGGIPYLEFAMQSENTVAWGRFVISGNVLYDVHVIYDADKFDSERYEYFVGSLRVQ